MGVRRVPKNLSRLFEAMVEGRIHRSQELIESCKQSVAHTRQLLRELEEEMQTASANLEFERAALLRDQIMEVKSGTGLTKIEPRRKPVKYSRGGAQRRRSRV